MTNDKKDSRPMCDYCKHRKNMIKNGKDLYGRQRFFCRACLKFKTVELVKPSTKQKK